VKKLVAVVVLALIARGSCRHGERLRFATFNIENFPKDARQIDGAFAEIAALDASFVAVQEISQPRLFLATAQQRLGARWDFIHVDTAPLGAYASHHNGVLFDRDVWQLVSWTSYDDTRDGGRHKPTLEVRLRPADGGDIVRVLVVHLKSGSEGRDIRARQLRALGPLAERAMASGERVVVLGDFNATNDDDRADIAAVGRRANMTWATEGLACSAFWRRDDGCPRSRLDHVLTWAAPAKVEAAGACATEGCDWEASCPVYAHQVSDHCPVVVTF
jgi:endonuclease/exonuclease/phosphatase family metal-dependent hydrolase